MKHLRRAGGHVCSRLLSLLWLPVWLCVIFFSNPTGYAMLLLSAILLHEGGHLLAFLLLREPLPRLGGRMEGLLLTPRAPLSYGREILVCAAGPLCNLLYCLCLVPALRTGHAHAATFCAFCLHLLTAFSNLLPIHGFDGARILEASLSLLPRVRAPGRIADLVSLGCAALLYFAALYLSLCAGGSLQLPALALFLLVGEFDRLHILTET